MWRVWNKYTVREQLSFFWFCFKHHHCTQTSWCLCHFKSILTSYKIKICKENWAGSLVLSNKYQRRSFLQIYDVFLVFCMFMRNLLTSRCWPTQQIFALCWFDLDIFKWCLFKRLNTDSHRHSESAGLFLCCYLWSHTVVVRLAVILYGHVTPLVVTPIQFRYLVSFFEM